MTDDKKVITTEEPVDRLTRMCAVMIVSLEEHDEYVDTDRAIILLDDGDHGGIVVHGYNPDQMGDAITDLLIHVKAMLHSIGKDLEIIAIPEDTRSLDGG